MSLQLKKAQRSHAYIKIGMSAPSGGGKTVSALFLGKGLMEAKHPDWTDAQQWEKIAIIDTENNSGQLYAETDISGVHIGSYNAVTLEAPFEADKYTQAIDLCEQAGMEVCIIDSTTHLWSGEGGLLEQQSNAAKRSGNSYTAWRDITPQHNRFVEKMLQTPMHLIATMRSKQEYVQEKGTDGKTTIRKVGLEPEQRKGMEYEFTIFFELDAEHTALGAKDRTSLFDQKYFRITPETGHKIMTWLEGATDEPSTVIATAPQKVDPEKAKQDAKTQIIELCKELGGQGNEKLMEILKRYHPSGNPNAIKESKQLADLYLELNDLKELQAQPQEAPAQPQEEPA